MYSLFVFDIEFDIFREAYVFEKCVFRNCIYKFGAVEYNDKKKLF